MRTKSLYSQVVILIVLWMTNITFAQIERVEPPFWYADMVYSDVQIMFYGKNIGYNQVSVSNNVVIKNVQKTENPNYIFVTIETKNVSAQELVFTFSKNKHNAQNQSGAKKTIKVKCRCT